MRLEVLAIAIAVCLTITDTLLSLGELWPEELVYGLHWSQLLVVMAALVSAIIPVFRLGAAFRVGLVSLAPLYLLVLRYHGAWPTIASVAAAVTLACAFRRRSKQHLVLAVSLLVLSTIAAGSWGLARHLRFRALEATVARGERLRQAIEAYRNDKGLYLPDFERLVPTYVSAVPEPELPWELQFQLFQAGDIIEEVDISEYWLVAWGDDFCRWIGDRRAGFQLRFAPQNEFAESSRAAGWPCEDLIDQSGSYRLFALND